MPVHHLLLGAVSTRSLATADYALSIGPGATWTGLGHSDIASRHGVSVGASCGITPGAGRPNASPEIFSLRHDFEMKGVNAGRVPAQVIADQIFRYFRAGHDLIGVSMCDTIGLPPVWVRDPDASVATVVDCQPVRPALRAVSGGDHLPDLGLELLIHRVNTTPDDISFSRCPDGCHH